MLYGYYNLRLWVKKINRTPDTKVISLDIVDTTTPWREEAKRLVMEEAPKWLEEHVVGGACQCTIGWVEVEKDLPLLAQTHLEKEIGVRCSHYLQRDRKLRKDNPLWLPPQPQHMHPLLP